MEMFTNSGYDLVTDGEVFEGEQNFRKLCRFKNEIIEEIKI
jgi:hypothetical protein